MKPKHPKLIEEIDVEVANRQSTVEERREINAFIRSYKAKAKGSIGRASASNAKSRLVCINPQAPAQTPEPVR